VHKTAVADTGPPLHLAEIEQENQLTIFGLVIISEQVKVELERHGVFDRIAAILGDHLTVESVTQSELDAQRAALSKFRVHQADLSMAVLAARFSPEVVLTDDLELRKGLEAQGCSVVGSVGVLVRAFEVGRLTKAELQAYLDQLFDGSTLYLSKSFRIYVHRLLDGLTN
jgi:predicted nucleic acid-binding protein